MPLVVAVEEVDGESTSYSSTDTVSLYFAADDEGNPFTLTEDSYSFENPGRLPSTETPPLSSLPGRQALFGFRQLMSWGGQCFGMSATAGLYLRQPDQKPRSTDPHSWDTSDADVMDAITDYHVCQVFSIGGNIADLFNGNNASEYNVMRGKLDNEEPVMLGLEDDKFLNRNGHSVLATKITEFDDLGQSFIEVYDSNYPDSIAVAQYSLSEDIFFYAGYGYAEAYTQLSANSVPSPLLCTGLDDWESDFYADVGAWLTESSRRIFAASFASPESGGGTLRSSPAKSTLGGGRVNLLVTNESGLQAGFLPDGSSVNEIPGAEIERVAAGAASQDSISFVYVPSEDFYEATMGVEEGGSVVFEEYSASLEAGRLQIAQTDSLTFSASTHAHYDPEGAPGQLSIDDDGDGTPDRTASVRIAEAQTGLVITEILADPPSGPSGDANADGVTDGGDDQFIEVINTSSQAAELSGYVLSDGAGQRHVIPSGTILQPEEALTVFGGGAPTGIPGEVQTASTGELELDPSGDTVTLQDNQGSTIRTVNFGPEASSGESLLLDPALSGDYVLHSTVQSAEGAIFSPGRRIGGAPLPVEITRLEGTMDDGTVTIRWTTASESKNAGFEVQRQATGQRNIWDNVGYVESRAQGGSSRHVLEYGFADASVPFQGDTLRYRLKQIDLDGTAHYSNQVTVHRGSVGQFEILDVYPNPAQQQATVRFAVPEGTEDVRLVLYDLLGRSVQALTVRGVGRQKMTLDTVSLASGMYFLRLTGDGKTRTEKVTVVR